MKTIQQWAQLVFDVQHACNLSGVVHSFSEFMSDLRKIYPDRGTDWYNQHPISKLFADKIASLTETQIYFDAFQAYQDCNNLLSGKEILY